MSVAQNSPLEIQTLTPQLEARTKPNFLLIGAQKAGTSWLATMLHQHPDVFTPQEKELHFFNLRPNYEKGLDWYLSHFDEAEGQTAIGECTPNYLWVTDAPDELLAERRARGETEIVFPDYPNLVRDIPPRVHAVFPDLRLLVVLRDPVKRAISSFQHAIRSRHLSPRSRILDVGSREGILGMGFYYRHLVEWMKVFPRERFLTLIYEEDIARNKKVTLERVFRHLEVDDGFCPEDLDARYNPTPGHLFLHVNYYLPAVAPALFRTFPALKRVSFPRVRVTDEDLDRLYLLYESENRRLEELLGRSLSRWHR